MFIAEIITTENWRKKISFDKLEEYAKILEIADDEQPLANCVCFYNQQNKLFSKFVKNMDTDRWREANGMLTKDYSDADPYWNVE